MPTVSIVRRLLCVIALALAFAAPMAALAGGLVTMQAPDAQQDQSLIAVPDEGCPAGDCGGVCPPVKCLNGPCAASGVGLTVDAVVSDRRNVFESFSFSQTYLGLRLLPDPPPPRG